MGIGISIVLIAVGLILALAVDFSVAGLDIQFVGWILAVVGVIGLIMTGIVWGRRPPAVADTHETVVEERRIP